MMLVLTVLGSTDSDRKNIYMPTIPIGMAVALGIMIGVRKLTVLFIYLFVYLFIYLFVCLLFI
jgi:hypothetical protein